MKLLVSQSDLVSQKFGNKLLSENISAVWSMCMINLKLFLRPNAP